MNAIRLVIADDHATIRDALKLLLGNQPDLQVVGDHRRRGGVAGGGQPAARRAADGRQHAGHERAAGHGGRQSAVPSVNILALHAARGGKLLGQLLRAGASGYALKQSSSNELINAIRTVAGEAGPTSIRS